MKRIHIIALIIIAVAIGFIISLVGDYSQYEDFTAAKKAPDHVYQVVGTLVKEKPLQYDALKDPNYFSFWMKDNKGQQCQVVFTGSKPQDFERTESIVLTGKMKGDEFFASQILMKCPSKYRNDQLQVSKYTANI
jgi:cytochrome c-type biogenesis protein CcmE